ncbi:hypothetical protein E5L41_00290 [Helicobacter pylori]|nr:hypothetical protein E5L41_00290 [Helicobacter pylori]
MGTFIEKCFGFYQVREELEARISELEDEKENLTNENTRLLASKEWLIKENAELLRDKDNLNNQLDASQMQVNALKNSYQVLENEKDELLK